MTSRFSLVVSAALLASGCSGGGNVVYMKMAPGTASAFSGTDCPGTGGPSTTFSGIDGDGTVAIYTEPNNKYFMDLGGAGVEGTISGSNYNFTGTWSADWKDQGPMGNDEIQTQETITLTLNSVGGGFTGTVSVQEQCQSASGTDCGAGNPLTVGAGGPFGGLTSGVSSTDAKDFSCSSSESLVAVQVSSVQQISSPAGSSPSGPTP